MAEAAKAVLDVNNDGKLDKADVEAGLAIAKTKATEAADYAKASYELAKEKGFFSHFMEYNMEIINPLKNAQSVTVDGVKEEVIATLKLQPKNAREGFVLYNGLALLFGIAESLIGALAGGGLLSLAWNGGASYCVAYTLYWLMVCHQDPKLMQYALVFLCLVSRPLELFSMARRCSTINAPRTHSAAQRPFRGCRRPTPFPCVVRCVRLPQYIGFSVYMALNTLIFVLPAVLYGSKAFVNVLQLLTGFQLLKAALGPEKSPFQML